MDGPAKFFIVMFAYLNLLNFCIANWWSHKGIEGLA